MGEFVRVILVFSLIKGGESRLTGGFSLRIGDFADKFGFSATGCFPSYDTVRILARTPVRVLPFGAVRAIFGLSIGVILRFRAILRRFGRVWA